MTKETTTPRSEREKFDLHYASSLYAGRERQLLFAGWNARASAAQADLTTALAQCAEMRAGLTLIAAREPEHSRVKTAAESLVIARNILDSTTLGQGWKSPEEVATTVAQLDAEITAERKITAELTREAATYRTACIKAEHGQAAALSQVEAMRGALEEVLHMLPDGTIETECKMRTLAANTLHKVFIEAKQPATTAEEHVVAFLPAKTSVVNESLPTSDGPMNPSPPSSPASVPLSVAQKMADALCHHCCMEPCECCDADVDPDLGDK